MACWSRRDISRALRKDFARSQSQSTEDADLARAEPRFNFDNKSWALPASESEYYKASSRWTATWPACPTRTSPTRSSMPAPTT